MAEIEFKQVGRAILFNEEGKVLLCKRARGLGVGQWALVGGKPEPGENLEEATKREVLEETSLIFYPRFYKQTLDDQTDPDHIWEAVFYSGSGEGEIRLKADENSEAGFFGMDEFDDLDIAFNHREILAEYFKSENGS